MLASPSDKLRKSVGGISQKELDDAVAVARAHAMLETIVPPKTFLPSSSDYQPPGEDEDLSLDLREAAAGEVQQERRAADEMLDAELLSQEPDS